MNVAFKTGFYSLEYFSEVFKQVTNLSPKKFKAHFAGKKNISIKDIEQINHSIIKLYEIANIRNIYLSKQKTSILPTKKLSFLNCTP
ncbi:MAG: hypothetical protein IJB71_05205 [Bacilli bacterium]|nr:hypothetical protein [Bacilli bacterium]